MTFMDDADSATHEYLAAVFTNVLDAAAKEAEQVTLTLGSGGSLAITVHNHHVLIFPQLADYDD